VAADVHRDRRRCSRSRTPCGGAGAGRTSCLDSWRRATSIDLYTRWTGAMAATSRIARAGARPGSLSQDLRAALRSEARRLADLGDPVEIARAVGDTFAALDAELERIAAVRLNAVRRLR